MCVCCVCMLMCVCACVCVLCVLCVLAQHVCMHPCIRVYKHACVWLCFHTPVLGTDACDLGIGVMVTSHAGRAAVIRSSFVVHRSIR